MNYRILTLSASLLVLATSCAAPVADTQAKLCTSLAQLKTSLAGMKSLSPTSTVGDLKKAQEEVKKAWGDVQTNAQALGDARADNLNQAYNDLDRAVNAVPNKATLSEGTASVQDEVAAVSAAQDQLYSGLQCQ
jgi:predicted nuclease with TOPRIM domain